MSRPLPLVPQLKAIDRRRARMRVQSAYGRRARGNVAVVGRRCRSRGRCAATSHLRAYGCSTVVLICPPGPLSNRCGFYARCDLVFHIDPRGGHPITCPAITVGTVMLRALDRARERALGQRKPQPASSRSCRRPERSFCRPGL